MRDQEKTKAQLISELEALRGRVAVLEHVDAERRCAEEELAKSKAILTAAIECLPFDFYALDPQGRCILQNALSRRYFGDAIGKTAEEICPDKRAVSRWLEGNRRALAGERVERVSDLWVEDRHRHFHSVLTPIQQGATLCGMLGVNVDITERKLAEEALRESEARYRTLAESSPDIIYILNAAGTLLYANRTAAAYMNRSPISLVGKNQTDLFPSAMAQQHLQRIRRVFETGEAAEMEQLYRFGAQPVWLNVRSIPLRDKQGRVTAVMGICRNITERKRTEEALRQSEQRLALHFQQTPLAAIEWDIEGRVTKWNPSAERVFGYTAEEALGQHFSFIVPARARESLDHVVDGLLTSSGGYRSTNENITKDGRTILCEWYNTPLVDATGAVVGAASLADDITERKAAEEALRNSERTLRTLIDASPESIYLVGTDGTILLANATAARRLNKRIDEVVNQKPHAVLPSDLADERLERVKEVVRSGQPVRFEDTRADRHFEIAIHPILDDHGQVAKLAMLGIDRTEHKRAEEALQRSEELFRTVFEEGPLGVALVGLDASIQRVNRRFCEMLGYAEQEIIALGIRGITHADDWEKDRHYGSRLLAGEISTYRIEKRYVRKDGHAIWGELTVSRMRDLSGNPHLIIGMIEDITERKRAEQALRASETKYRRLHESMRDAFVSVAMDGQILEYNEAYRVMLGYEPEELRAATYVELTPAQWHAFEAEIVEKQILPHGYSEIYEKEYRRKDGSVFPVELRTFLIRDEQDRPAAMWAIVRDITERKRAEATLRESEERFHAFMDNSPAVAWMKDEQGRYVYLSKSHEQHLGARLEAWHGKTDFEVWPPEVAERFSQNDKLVLASGTIIEGSEETVDSDGQRRHWWISKFPFQNALGKRYVGGVGMDITTQKRAEAVLQKAHDELERRVAERTAELRASEERYDLAVRGAGAGIFDWNILTGQVYYSPGWKRLFGYAEGDIGDRVEDWSSRLHPDERDSIVRRQDEFFAGASLTATAEYRLRHKDGSYRWIEAHVLVVRDAQGRACRLVGSHEDITERKLAQAALERERQSLWRMLQASDHERRIIAYEIHDGLAQYLTGAIMQFEVCKRHRTASPVEATSSFEAGLLMARQSLAEARRLISEVRPPIIDENGIETAISHLVHEQHRPGIQKIELHSSVQFDRLPEVVENAIYRIAQEALNNACRYSQSEKVTITLTQESHDLRLEIQDWGVGFNPDAVAKGHFGLEGIRQRVRLLGGRLKIESKPGAGTLIQAIVPIVQRQDEE